MLALVVAAATVIGLLITVIIHWETIRNFLLEPIAVARWVVITFGVVGFGVGLVVGAGLVVGLVSVEEALAALRAALAQEGGG